MDIELLDTRRGRDLVGTLIADFSLSLFSFMAQNERDNIRQRQAEGIAAARLRGVRFGRPPKEIPDNFGDLVRDWESKKITISEVLELCNMSRATFYVKLREYKLLREIGK